MYSDIHEKHVTVKGLGVGDILEYLVRYRTVKPEVAGQFWTQYDFNKDLVIRDEQLEISVPAGKYVKVSSPELKPQITDEAGRRVYRWKTSNLQRRDPELQPKRELPRPAVQLTTFRTWEEVGSWYAGLQKTQLELTPSIRAKAAEITKGLTTDDEKLGLLYAFVATRFHYASLSFGIGRFQPHPADEVLGNEYGDCKDKHTLLAALLKASGFEAAPALISSSHKFDPDVPSPGQFDHLITFVPRGDSAIWLDTTPEVAPFGLLTSNLRGQQALVVPSDKPAKLMKTPEVLDAARFAACAMDQLESRSL
jgi:transglutaminase-like putative cysteine protease